MADYESLLERTPLFSGFSAADIKKLLGCLGSFTRRYGAGEILWQTGENISETGIVLHGAVDAQQMHPDGSYQIVARHTAGGLIGDLLMASGTSSPVTVTAREESVILFLPLERIMSDCGKDCTCHVQLRLNLLRETAAKFWQQRRQIAYLTEPKLRLRIVRFLLDFSGDCGKNQFTVPYSRSDLAAYLGVNRSALSRELGRLQLEGYVAFCRRDFELLLPEGLQNLLEKS